MSTAEGTNADSTMQDDGSGVVVIACECGSTRFRYEESHPSLRTMLENAGGELVFEGEFEWFDGDNTPGVVCEKCERTVDLPDGSTVSIS